MIIKYLELINFKSYGGKKIIGPFNQKMSCIIGPNGSGKSNIIDSILFVFGFRSNKLRQDNLKNLIHYSANWKAKSCKVTICLQDQKKQNFNISRIISETGNSHYQLNKHRTTLQQIRKILQKSGIDLKTNHFIILQGEIERLTELNALQLLNHMQQVCGSYQFIDQINQKQQIYEIIKGDRIMKQLKVQILEKELIQIKNQKQTAQLWINQKKKVLKLENMINLINLDKNKKTIQANNKQVQKLQNKKNKQLQQINIQERKIYEFDIIIKQKKMDIEDSKKRRTFQQQKINKMKIRIQNMQRQIKFKQKDYTNHYKKRTDYDDQIQGLKIDKTQEIPLIKQKILNLNNQLKLFKKDQIDKINQILTIDKQKQQLIENLKKSHIEKEKIQAQLKQSKLHNEHQQLNKKLIKIGQLKFQLKKIKNQKIKIQQKIKSSQSNLNSFLYKLKNQQNQTNTFNSLLTIKKQLKKVSGTLLNGIKGTLRDFCWVDPKYQYAFNVICPQLDYLIVDTYNNVMQVTKYLKQRKLGRATFIIVQKIQQFTQLNSLLLKPFYPPQNSSRLYDLVNIKNSQYKFILYWALGDTLVTQNLDKAVKIAYGKQRHRVVTQNGYIIDYSGAMTYCQIPDAVQDIQILKQKIKLVQKQIFQYRNNLKLIIQLIQKNQEQINQVQIFRDNNLKKITNEQKMQLQSRLKYLNQRILKDQEKIQKIKNQGQKSGVTQFRFNTYIGIKRQFDNQNRNLKRIEYSENIINKLRQKRQLELKKQNQSQKQIEKLNKQKSQLQNDKQKSCQIKKQLDIKIRQMEKQLRDKQQQKFIIQLQKNNNKSIQVSNQKIQKIHQNNKNLQIQSNLIKKYIDQLKIRYNQYSKYQVLPPVQNSYSLRRKGIIIPQIQNTLQLQLTNHDLDKYKIYLTIQTQKVDQIERDMIKLQQIQNYKIHKKKLQQHQTQFNQIVNNQNYIKDKIDKLKNSRYQCFMTAFQKLNSNLKQTYRYLTGGDIDLNIIDTSNPFAQGLQLSVRPVNKSWKKVNLLSGGEKTMSSLSLIFAFHEIKKCPFYFLDQIDAALDYKNTSFLARYIRDKKDCQFIIVSLRRNMYQQSKTLTGIYKVNDETQSITINVRQFEQQQERKKQQMIETNKNS